MVGLSVVLENQKSSSNINILISKKSPQVISSTNTRICSSSSCLSLSPYIKSELNYPVPSFLQQCFLCKQKLLPAKDIYMYKGDRAFCSVECRCKQILMDEEEILKKANCSLAAMNPSSSSSSSAPSALAVTVKLKVTEPMVLLIEEEKKKRAAENWKMNVFV